MLRRLPLFVLVFSASGVAESRRGQWNSAKQGRLRFTKNSRCCVWPVPRHRASGPSTLSACGDAHHVRQSAGDRAAQRPHHARAHGHVRARVRDYESVMTHEHAHVRVYVYGDGFLS